MTIRRKLKGKPKTVTGAVGSVGKRPNVPVEKPIPEPPKPQKKAKSERKAKK